MGTRRPHAPVRFHEPVASRGRRSAGTCARWRRRWAPTFNGAGAVPAEGRAHVVHGSARVRGKASRPTGRSGGGPGGRSWSSAGKGGSHDDVARDVRSLRRSRSRRCRLVSGALLPRGVPSPRRGRIWAAHHGPAPGEAVECRSPWEALPDMERPMKKGTSQLSRRDFARTAALAAGAFGAAELLGAAEAEVKVGLYSITYLGVWYRGGALTLEQVIQRAKQYGYEGVEIDGKRPHGNPLDWPKGRGQDLLRYAHDHGVEIYAVAGEQRLQQPDTGASRVPAGLHARPDPHDRGPRREGAARVPGLARRDAAARGRWPLRHRQVGLAEDARGVLAGGDLGVVPRRPGGVGAARGGARSHPGAAEPRAR